MGSWRLCLSCGSCHQPHCPPCEWAEWALLDLGNTCGRRIKSQGLTWLGLCLCVGVGPSNQQLGWGAEPGPSEDLCTLKVAFKPHCKSPFPLNSPRLAAPSQLGLQLEWLVEEITVPCCSWCWGYTHYDSSYRSSVLSWHNWTLALRTTWHRGKGHF